MSFDFKQVQLGEEGKRAKRQEKLKHWGKTALYMVIAIAVSLGISFINEGSKLSSDEIQNGIFFGAFIGFFLTNSPCARGRC